MVCLLERVQIMTIVLFLLVVLPVSLYLSSAAQPDSDDLEVSLYHTKSDLINQEIEIYFEVNNTNWEESVTVDISLKIDGEEVINVKNEELGPFPLGDHYFAEILTVSSDHPCTILIEAHVETSRGKSYDVQSSITIYETLEGQIIVFCRMQTPSSEDYENQRIRLQGIILNNRTAPIRGDKPFKISFSLNGSSCSSSGGSAGMGVLAGEERVHSGCRARYPPEFDDPVKFVVHSNFTLGSETWEWQQILHMYPNVSRSWLTEPILLRHYQTAPADQTQSSDVEEDISGFGGKFILFCLLTIAILRKYFKWNMLIKAFPHKK
ncbi:MAG: hypothetical protein ACXAEI_10835 [Candidatus Hodarchaeales archaeon]|jgi:hypothetical protein